MKKYITTKSKVHHEEMRQYLTDGVGSYFHINSYRDYPIAIKSGKGSKLYDLDGNEYIDYVLGFGPMLLGYCNENVNRAVEEQLARGSHFSAPTEELLQLSRRLTEIIPCADRVAYGNSGTEVVMYALRLARAFTGKYKIIKFEGQYHGWSDEEKISISAEKISELGDREHPNKIIHSRGQRLSSADDLVIAPWNDAEAVRKILSERDDIAGIIMEPVMFDSGPILPRPGYLKQIRELADQYGAVLIFDEVITGFRLSLGGAQSYYGVTPDLSTFAKAIAGGYPFGVIAGRKEIMECGIHASGTFNANPVGTAAALATIRELSRPGVYERLEELSQKLARGFVELGKKYRIPVYSRGIGSICILYFGFEDDRDDFRDWLAHADIPLYTEFVKRCEEYGIRFTDKRGREYLSTQHTEEDILRTLQVADQVLYEIVAEKGV